MPSFHQVGERKKVLEGVKQKIDTSKEILRLKDSFILVVSNRM